MSVPANQAGSACSQTMERSLEESSRTFLDEGHDGHFSLSMTAYVAIFNGDFLSLAMMRAYCQADINDTGVSAPVGLGF